jgi:hypothetical protein
MTLDYAGSTTSEVPGKGSTVAVKFKGEHEGLETIVTFKSSHMSYIHDVIPKGLREIALEIIDPNMKIEEFEPKYGLTEELTFGIPIDKPVISGKCSDCAIEMWVYPDEINPLCPQCEKERKRAAFRAEQKEDIKDKRLKEAEIKAEDEFILRIEEESPAEYEARKQGIRDKAYLEERKRRAAAKEVKV